MNHEKILITGAGGLVGSTIIELLNSRQYKVLGLYNTQNVLNFAWEAISADLTSQSLTSLLAKFEDLTTIVHCAAKLPTNSAEFSKVFEINKKIDENVLNFLRTRQDIKLIYISGTSVYGITNGVFSETSICKPMNDYAKGKKITEDLIKDHLKNYIILRISSPYSPKQRSKTVIKLFIERALANLPLTYHGSGQREQDFIAIEDVSKAILKCIKNRSAHGIFNISSGEIISMKNLADLIVRLVPNCKSVVESSGLPDEQEDYRPNFPTKKAKDIIDWVPETSLVDGISKWINNSTK
jgi:nucleoside-diphosphate-sugar epimerase